MLISETHQQILPPDFTKNLKSVDVLESSPLSMECHVTGIPSPTISWYRDDQSIDSSPEFIITKINGTCCLKIRQAARHHSARYTCRANNPGGEAASSARITVVRKDTLISRLDPSPRNVLLLCILCVLLCQWLQPLNAQHEGEITVWGRGFPTSGLILLDRGKFCRYDAWLKLTCR